MGPAERWLRANEPAAFVPSVDDDTFGILMSALDNFGEWSLHLAAKRGLLPDVWSEAIEAAEELGL